MRRKGRRAPSPPPIMRRKGRREPSPSPPPADEAEDDDDEEEDCEEEEEEDCEREYEEGEDSEEGEEEEELPVFDLEDKEGEARVWEEPDEYVEPEYTGMPQEPGTREPYMRGQAELPSMETWVKKGGIVELTPRGKSSFVYKGGRYVRTYSSILGCIIKKYYPGAVKMSNGRWVIVSSWRKYKRAKDPLGMKHKFLANCQARVLTEFWTYFQMDPDCNRDECIAQSHRTAVKQVTDSMHEARVGCVRRWYAEKHKLPMQNKSRSRNILMEPWQYLQVPPPFIGHARPGVYRAIVHWWTSAEFKRRNEEGKLKRAEMGGGSHTQGSLPMAVCIQNAAKELGAEPSIFTVWSKFHKKKNKEDGTLTWVSPNAELKDTEYRKFFATTHPGMNPDTEPFDPEVAMCAGGGRKNGRLWMCDSAVDPKTVRSIREIRRDNSISSSSIQSRPIASSRAIDKIREDLENERRRGSRLRLSLLSRVR